MCSHSHSSVHTHPASIIPEYLNLWLDLGLVCAFQRVHLSRYRVWRRRLPLPRSLLCGDGGAFVRMQAPRTFLRHESCQEASEISVAMTSFACIFMTKLGACIHTAVPAHPQLVPGVSALLSAWFKSQAPYAAHLTFATVCVRSGRIRLLQAGPVCTQGVYLDWIRMCCLICQLHVLRHFLSKVACLWTFC